MAVKFGAMGGVCKMMLPAIKQALKEKKISHRKIASELDINHGAVTSIINGTYKGAEETKARVLKHIELLLIDKPDLNPLIYGNIDTFIKSCWLSIKNPKHSIEETQLIYLLYDILKKFKARTEPGGIDSETE